MWESDGSATVNGRQTRERPTMMIFPLAEESGRNDDAN
jgi:hypothetical protein